MTNERAILAGGCFWGMEELFRTLPGVIATRVGYAGGHTSNPTYETMKGGNHAEALEITFDPTRLNYQRLLEFFFQIHDPSTPNRQGNDRGPQYRSAIFYETDIQRQTAEDVIARVNATGRWPGKVVTEVAQAGTFWEAEEYHQKYLLHRPHGYTCHYARPDWVLEENHAPA